MHPLLNCRPGSQTSSPNYGQEELRLELQRVRAAAEAARLDARAAEIQLLLNRWQTKTSGVVQGPNPTLHTVGPQLTSWQDLLDVAERLEATEGFAPVEKTEAAAPVEKTKALAPVEKTKDLVPVEKTAAVVPVAKTDRSVPQKLAPPVLAPAATVARKSLQHPAAIDEQPAPRRRIRPGAWISSLVGHGMGLVILAWITLAVAEPKDQIALSAAIVPNDEADIQTIVLEQAEQPDEAEQEAMAEAEPTSDLVSTVNELSVAIPTPQSTTSAMTSSSLLGDSLGKNLATTVSRAAGATGDLSTQFFGAEGGGNHFVYLVDNSGSMDNIARDGFDVARDEVLRAVANLRSEQRFYVVFFGEQTLKMQLDPTQPPSEQSVYATDENKAALRHWALGLTMQSGKWPEEALEFAFELRPDCIFLLTDGAMPNYVGNFIKEANTMDTLFYGPKPRSIIHTIGFHNSEGEAQLRSIAESNGGTYHFVPAKPARQ